MRRGAGAARALFIALGLAVLGQGDLLACPQCFGAEESTVMAGTKLGVLAMLGVTIAIQAAFVGFFLYLRRRAQRIADLELAAEWSELQRGSRTS